MNEEMNQAPMEGNPLRDFETDPHVLAIRQAAEAIISEIGKVIIGQDDTLRLMVTAMIAGGHVLIEGVPGIAKTLSARLLARTLNTGFSRIQFTPDLMPSDVIGTSVFDMKTSAFHFKQGPVFSNIVLIDEINRAPAKTQSALFEAMEERSVSVDGITHILGEPFFVVATQNPIEQEGTYRLPEAQLDRFLFRIKMGYPSLEEEKAILERFKEDFSNDSIGLVRHVLDGSGLMGLRQKAQKVKIKKELNDYIAAVVHETRNDGDLFLGASPRASLAIMRTSKVYAAIAGRDFVTPEDIRAVALPVLNHRLILTPERELEGVEIEDAIRKILSRVEIPR